jgi:hypothetical protein
MAAASQKDKVKSCNARAKEKSLKGDARKTFMSGCLTASGSLAAWDAACSTSRLGFQPVGWTQVRCGRSARRSPDRTFHLPVTGPHAGLCHQSLREPSAFPSFRRVHSGTCSGT